MAEPKDAGQIESYHAHVYFDAESRDRAWALRERITDLFDIEMGRFHEKNVGPHPRWSYQVAFKPALFSEFVPWLMLNRDDLVVFLHPNTSDDMADHRDFPIWMGGMPDMDLSIFE
ncbi:MAG: DOPA 4,5-dioxygenase family protein [Alphaproteobacteria bacterium]|jgi:DOPA 4,5-dioxygenase|nr:DOPA 4,5-dioxygenase family protein [Alphaproteobacteria bacterium]